MESLKRPLNRMGSIWGARGIAGRRLMTAAERTGKAIRASASSPGLGSKKGKDMGTRKGKGLLQGGFLRPFFKVVVSDRF